MSVDYTDLNKASLKDCFPLLRIDQLMDSNIGHIMLRFMDTFSSYNQIHIDPKYGVYTLFITGFETYYYKVIPFSLKNVRAF